MTYHLFYFEYRLIVRSLNLLSRLILIKIRSGLLVSMEYRTPTSINRDDLGLLIYIFNQVITNCIKII